MTRAATISAVVSAPGPHPAPAEAAAEIEGLSYSYPTGEGVALAGVNLRIDGGMTLVSGPSGGGKSTLLRLLNGLVPHYHGGRIRGRAEVCGLDVLVTPARRMARAVGFVFQDPESQFVYSSVEREVAFGLENLGVSPRLMSARVDEALERAGVAHLQRRRIATLSGGERQRVAIASALALGPRLLVLDEPTAQLDPDGAATVVDSCAHLAALGTAVVISEHRLDALLCRATTMVSVAAGRILAASRARNVVEVMPDPPPLLELGRRLAWPRVCLEVDEARPLAPALRRLPQRGWSGEGAWRVEHLVLGYQRQLTLEDLALEGGAGEVVVLMGPNGSGKTTLLRALAGLHAPLSGAIERPTGRIAYLPQDPAALLHQSSVRAEVELTMRYNPGGQHAEGILAELGLSDVADCYPRDLSSGQRQRSAVAAILAGSPAMALLDEPTRGMDAEARRALGGVLRRLASEGTAIVIATHDSDLAAEVGDRVIRLESGTARDLGPPRTALSGETPWSTQIGRLFPGQAVTVQEVMACL